MKPAKSVESSFKNDFEATSPRAQKSFVQMALLFDTPNDQSGNGKCLTVNPIVESLEHAAPYSSVKRISLIFEGSLEGRPCLTSTKEAIEFFRQYWTIYPGNDQERVVVACLDTKHRVQCVVVVTVGTLDASLVHPREVFKPAFIEGSSAIVLSHNHPSGNPEPSREDRQVTDRLTEAGKLLGITVLDHIIHGDGTGHIVSIRDSD